MIWIKKAGEAMDWKDREQRFLRMMNRLENAPEICS